MLAVSLKTFKSTLHRILPQGRWLEEGWQIKVTKRHGPHTCLGEQLCLPDAVVSG